MKTVNSSSAPAAIGPYSHAVVHGGLVFTSGQIPVDPSSGAVKGSDIETQTRAAINNLGFVLKDAGSSFDNVIKTTCFLNDINDFAKFNEIYAEYFTSKPARSCVEVSALPKGVLVEIEAVAEISE